MRWRWPIWSWGFGAILFGFWSDKYGAGRTAASRRVVLDGRVLPDHPGLNRRRSLAAGVLLGLGSSGSGVTALVGAVGRAVPPHQRTAAIASLGMATGIATFLAYPYVHVLIEWLGWRTSLLAVAATVALTLPLTVVLAGRRATSPRRPSARPGAGVPGQTMTRGVRGGLRHPRASGS